MLLLSHLLFVFVYAVKGFYLHMLWDLIVVMNAVRMPLAGFHSTLLDLHLAILLLLDRIDIHLVPTTSLATKFCPRTCVG